MLWDHSNDIKDSDIVKAVLYGSLPWEAKFRSLSVSFLICLNAGLCLSKLQIKAKDSVRALEMSICEVVMAPSTEASGTDVLWHLSDMWCILCHMTKGDIVQGRQDMRLPRSMFNSVNNMLCFSMEALKLCNVCPPKDRNTVRPSGQPPNRSASESKDHVSKMFSQ